MRYLSVCSGIEAATVAWHPLGWEPVAFSEIETFPSSVLAHHYPTVPNLGDMTRFKEWPDLEPDVLVGGTPCQSFSVAGLRKGLDDPRGNLMLTYLAIANRYRPKWLVWENVPGVLSSGQGRDFAAFLRGLDELGYGWSYRVLDAQYFGVAQRRRRVFVVGCLGSWQRAAAVLFERASLSGHPAPRRETGQRATRPIAGSSERSSGYRLDADRADDLIPSIANPLTARMHKGVNTTCDEGQTMIACEVADSLTVGANQTTCFVGDVVAHSLRASGFDASEDGTGRGTPLVPVAFNWQATGKQSTLGANTLGANTLGANTVQAVMTLAIRGRGDSHDLEVRQDGTANALLTPNGGRAGIGVGAVAFAIQGAATRENPNSGPDGVGVRDDGCAYTIEARAEVQAVAFDTSQVTSATNRSNPQPGEPCHTLHQGATHHVAFTAIGNDRTFACSESDVRATLDVGGGTNNQTYGIRSGMQVRRLTPVECARLQGFPDHYLDIIYRGKPAADGPKYKALGNSMAVPCMAWIGHRIAQVAAIKAA